MILNKILICLHQAKYNHNNIKGNNLEYKIKSYQNTFIFLVYLIYSICYLIKKSPPYFWFFIYLIFLFGKSYLNKFRLIKFKSKPLYFLKYKENEIVSIHRELEC